MIAQSFWDGFERISATAKEMDPDIDEARKNPPQIEPQRKRARFSASDTEILKKLHSSSSLSGKDFVLQAQQQGVTLEKKQIQGWLARNNKKN